MTVSNAQVRKLMEETSKHEMLGLAALKAGIDRMTAAKDIKLGSPVGDLR